MVDVPGAELPTDWPPPKAADLGAAAAPGEVSSPAARPSPFPDPSTALSWQQAAVTDATPQGVDAASYLAGERAAYARAFSFAVPSQQALGQLFGAVEQLHVRLETDARAVRDLQLSQAREATALELAVQRLDVVERSALPELQRKWEDVATRPALSPEVADALQHLRDVLANLSAAQRQYLEAATGYGGRAGLLVDQLRWLLAAAAGYASAALSGADVAAVFLSRKVLVGDVAGRGGQTRTWAQAGASAALIVGSVEAAWQVHERVVQRLPSAVARAAGPVRFGLRAARVAVWSAAFVLAAGQLRAACFAAGDRLAGGAAQEDLAEQGRLVAPQQQNGSLATTPARSPAAPGSAARALRPHSAGSPPPPSELMRENSAYEEPAADD